jgi:hypothetical protein
MAIIIVDNFQVDINNPIDNRFVVGSQSIPSGSPSLYPTPFYAYKEDIIYKYPGLRIWDFNDNVPYVWDGTQWINENTTGALVQNAATGNTGFQNYVTKFANNQTLLTASSIYDSGTHVGVGLNATANPDDNSSFGPGNPGQISPVKGFHVAGNIKTNAYFIGNIHADWIVSGTLNLVRIAPPGTPPSSGVYILKNTNGSGSGTSWDLVSNIVPIPQGINLTATTTSGSLSTGNIFGGLNGSNQYTFKPLISTGLQITDSTNEIRIESKAGINLGASDPNSIDGEAIYAGLDTDNIHKFKRIKSNTLQVTTDTNNNSIKIEVPATFEGTDYYVNGLYPGTEELGTRSKPFKSMKACLNKILNRSSLTGPNAISGWTSPDTGTQSINGGNAYEKWQNLQATRVVIQSFLYVEENIAINSVTYFLEKGGYSSHLFIPDTTDGNNLEWMFDMKPLVDGATSDPTFSNNLGVLNNSISCRLEGSGTLTFHGNHPRRKGFFRAVGSNSFDKNNIAVTTFTQENGCFLFIGSVGGNILLQMDRLPQGTDISYGVTPPQNKVVRCTITFTGALPANGSRFTYDIAITPSTPGLGGTYSNQSMYNTTTGAQFLNTFDKTFTNLLNVNDVGRCPIGSTVAITLSNLKSNLELFNRDPNIEYSTNGSNQLYIDLTTLSSNTVSRLGTNIAGPATNLNHGTSPSTLSTFNPTTTINYVNITDEDGVIREREGTQMLGHVTTFTPDYGVIHVEGRNLPYHEALFLNGIIQINCFEQHMLYGKNYGSIYSENGRIYMRRNYQKVLYSKEKYIPVGPSTEIPYTGAGSYYEIVALGNNTNWHLLGTNWRDTNGNPITTPANNAAVRIGYIFKRNSTAVLLPSGVHGLVQTTRKAHLPCNHVYDVYLKDGAVFSHGGDFYTQQNTGQNAGGADSFVFLENTSSTSDTYIQYNSKMCGFSANGGGVVTNLFYNSYIKVGYHVNHTSSYLSHQVNFRTLKLNSQPWGHLIKAINSTGASVKFTLYGFNLIDSLMSDIMFYGEKRIPFSNISIKPGLLWVSGTSLELANGTSFNVSIPQFVDNTAAKTQLSIGMFYRDNSGNLKVVI